MRANSAAEVLRRRLIEEAQPRDKSGELVAGEGSVNVNVLLDGMFVLIGTQLSRFDEVSMTFWFVGNDVTISN